MDGLISCGLLLATLIFMKGVAINVAINVNENSEVTIECHLGVQYPKWTGPEGLATPLTDGQIILEPGFEWDSNKNLKIAKAMLKHDGNYTCSDSNNASETVEVDVRYFSARAGFTEASSKNTTTIMTCLCYSNPPCKIIPHTVTHIRPGQEDVNQDSKVTFLPCETDPSNENKTKCSVVAVMKVSKEDNGQEMRCLFQNNVSSLTLYPKVKFIFPSTTVNVTAKEDNSKLTLNCSTDSSNPVTSLTWYRGINPTASFNSIINSGFKPYIMDAKYNGKNVTQALDIEKENIRSGEKVFCCAGHGSEKRCDSFNLENYQISGCGVVKASFWIFIFSVVVNLV